MDFGAWTKSSCVLNGCNRIIGTSCQGLCQPVFYKQVDQYNFLLFALRARRFHQIFTSWKSSPIIIRTPSKMLSLQSLITMTSKVSALPSIMMDLHALPLQVSPNLFPYLIAFTRKKQIVWFASLISLIKDWEIFDCLSYQFS